MDRQSHAVTDRTVCWLRVPLAHRTGTLRGSVSTAAQHTHSCSTAALSREYMDLLRHLPWQTDGQRHKERQRGWDGEGQCYDFIELCRLILEGEPINLLLKMCVHDCGVVLSL